MIEKINNIPIRYWTGFWLAVALFISLWVTPMRIYVIGAIVVYSWIMCHYAEMSQWNWPVILTASLFFFIVLVVAVTYTGSWSYITGRKLLLEEQRSAAPAMPEDECQLVLQILDVSITETWACNSNNAIATLIRESTQEFQGSRWADRQATALFGPNWDQPWDVPALSRERAAYVNSLSQWQDKRYYTDWSQLGWIFVVALFLPIVSGVLRSIDYGVLDFITIIIPTGVGVVTVSIFMFWYDYVYWDVVLLAFAIEIIGIFISIATTFALKITTKIPVSSKSGYYSLMAVMTAIQSIATLPWIILIAMPMINNIISTNVDMIYSKAIIAFIIGVYIVKSVISLVYQIIWLVIGE